ncbi:MAG: hypothetical protein IJX17_05235 [Clostridia bacterium]|nr:hypothetical protein [Clostridia bacterium]
MEEQNENIKMVGVKDGNRLILITEDEFLLWDKCDNFYNAEKFLDEKYEDINGIYIMIGDKVIHDKDNKILSSERFSLSPKSSIIFAEKGKVNKIVNSFNDAQNYDKYLKSYKTFDYEYDLISEDKNFENKKDISDNYDRVVLKSGELCFLNVSQIDIDNLPLYFNYEMENLFIEYIKKSDIPFIFYFEGEIHYDESFNNKSKIIETEYNYDEVLKMLGSSKKLYHYVLDEDIIYIGLNDGSNNIVIQKSGYQNLWSCNLISNEIEYVSVISEEKELDAILSKTIFVIVKGDNLYVHYQFDDSVFNFYIDGKFLIECYEKSKYNFVIVEDYVVLLSGYVCYSQTEPYYINNCKVFSNKVKSLVFDEFVSEALIVENLDVTEKTAQNVYRFLKENGLIEKENGVEKFKKSQVPLILKLLLSDFHLFQEDFGYDLRNYNPTIQRAVKELIEINKKNYYLISNGYLTHNLIKVDKILKCDFVFNYDYESKQLLEFATKKNKERYEKLLSQIKDDKGGEIYYKIAQIHKDIMWKRSETEFVNNTQWNDVIVKNSTIYIMWLKMSACCGNVLAKYELLHFQEKTNEDYRKIMLGYEDLFYNHNCLRAGERLGYLYTMGSNMFFNQVMPHLSQEKSFLWYKESTIKGNYAVYESVLNLYERLTALGKINKESKCKFVLDLKIGNFYKEEIVIPIDYYKYLIENKILSESEQITRLNFFSIFVKLEAKTQEVLDTKSKEEQKLFKKIKNYFNSFMEKDINNLIEKSEKLSYKLNKKSPEILGLKKELEGLNLNSDQKTCILEQITENYNNILACYIARKVAAYIWYKSKHYSVTYSDILKYINFIKRVIKIVPEKKLPEPKKNNDVVEEFIVDENLQVISSPFREDDNFDNELLTKEKLFEIIKETFEFGDVYEISKYLNQDTIYESQSLKKVLRGREEVLNFLTENKKFIYKLTSVVICRKAIAKTDCLVSNIKSGQEFILLDYSDYNIEKNKSTISFEIKNNFIKKIIIKNEIPEYEIIDNNYL